MLFENGAPFNIDTGAQMTRENSFNDFKVVQNIPPTP